MLKNHILILTLNKMETYQAEWLDVLLSQSAKVLNRNSDTEETDASTTLI